MVARARVLIVGLGRSGTSWVLKTFDQHPQVFALHEPDLIIPDRARTQREMSDADLRRFADDIFACRGLRAMRKRPIPRKAYRPYPAHLLRVGYMYAASVLEAALPASRQWVRRLSVPDLANLRDAVMVAKCVGLQHQVGHIARANPDLPILYVIRHPCGFVASLMDGIERGKMSDHYLPPRADLGRLFSFDRPAAELTEDAFSLAEILAYRWVVYNDVVWHAAQARQNIHLIRYEDLCADPVNAFRRVFDLVGLSWSPRCEAFVAQSLAASGDASAYHGLVRNPLIAAEKWKTTMSDIDREAVLRIAEVSPVARLFGASGDVPERADGNAMAQRV